MINKHFVPKQRATMSEATESEKMFERYLNGQNLAWDRVPETQLKQPDYRVEHNRKPCFFEVKEFSDPATKPVGAFSSCPAIQEKLTQARKQFRDYRNYCCAVVLWNSKSIYRTLLLDTVASGAFGKYVTVDADPAQDLGANPPRFRYSGPAELSENENTTISAIVILAPYRLNHLWLEMWRIVKTKHNQGKEITPWVQFDILQRLSSERAPSLSYEGTIRVIVIENPFARIPFPPDLFVGPFDQRWRMESAWLSLSFVGSELAKLKDTGVPFIYL
ncbi:MAG: hypothetical protein WCC21_03705 [Candidatus Acidiferrales bacterium]